MKTEQMVSKTTPGIPATAFAGLPGSGMAGIQTAPQAKVTTPVSKMKKRIKLLLVDDHPVVRRGIASCLAQHEHLQIIGEAADGREALRKVRELCAEPGNKRYCTVRASTAVFGDPCPGTSKYLEVDYDCIGV